jgi:hypothetical protein
MDKMNKNQQVCALLKIEYIGQNYTTKSGRIELLEIMSKRDDWEVFIAWTEIAHLHNLDFKGDTYFIDVSYILDLPGKPNFNDRLLDAVIKFLEAKK